LETYFSDTTNPLVRHHLDSYADLLKNKIPKFIEGKNPLSLTLGDDRIIEIYIGELKYLPPVDELGNAILPHMCRLNNLTYTLEIQGQITVKYISGDDEIGEKVFENIVIGKIPLMLKSSLCYLASMTSEELYEAGECKFELGGYFIIDGAEKALLTQEQLSDNTFYASKRIVPTSTDSGKKTLVEKEDISELESATKGSKYEYIAAIKSVSEDGTKGPYSHYLIIPPENVTLSDPKKISKTEDFSSQFTNRLALITLPGFTQPVPLISVFYALGLTNDRDIYDTILCGIPEEDRTQFDGLFAELILSHEKFIVQEMAKETDQGKDPNLLFLSRQTRTRSNGGVYVNLYTDLFPHCAKWKDSSSAVFYRRKAYLLGHLTRMAMQVAIGGEKTDRDNLKYKRLYCSGDLIFREFAKVFKDVSKRMLVELDTRVHFEQQAYAGKRLVDLVQEENINYYWKSYEFMNNISKSFKGKWGGKDGVSQELTRLSYLGCVAQLRRVNVDMPKDAKIIETRRIHASSWGLLCPSDNPDGGNIGLIKSMTLLCSISTASSAQELTQFINETPNFKLIFLINPTLWNPTWTKIFVNSDLIGVCEQETEKLHEYLLESRRNGTLDKYTSLSWNRQANEYIIFTDAGRPLRPIYREGVRASEVSKVKKWSKMITDYMDYVDAQETETLRISMEPFSEKYPSEIHGSTIFSASASVLPNCDFNAGVRNAFSCQQTKQACSWYNTAFTKRFDTISTWLNYAQRPLSQTWAFKNMMGCLPYGENPVVALMIYSGYNQEDSILLNEASLKRGMFHTTVYHSYEIEEKLINVMTRTHTEMGNPFLDPKYRETVVRKEGHIYDFLDGDGIILPGSEVTDKTVLCGMLSPKFNEAGQLIGHNDASQTPKKGQVGIVDAVYRYPTREGLRGIKIRIAEHRLPVLGDKFSARHGQKGTCGMRVPEEDMPFTARGIRPDMIVNPHAFPTRMTIGMFLEMMSTKLGVEMGALVDGTPFTTINRVGETKDLLLRAGFEPNGHELMYNGQTGEMVEAEIFMGPTHYLRLKQMVEDKINYRATGPKKLLTRQPLEGRSSDGGLRIGEMEKDILIAHGMSKFIRESFMERSDSAKVLFQPETGLFDASTDKESVKLEIPYVLSLLVHELEAMHLSMKLASP
jgi:DNA-directed RNA polymerase II subunit RPB2